MRPKFDAVPMYAVRKDFYGKRVMFAAFSHDDLAVAYSRAFGPNAGIAPGDALPVIVASLEEAPEPKPNVEFIAPAAGLNEIRAALENEKVVGETMARRADEYLRQLGEANAHVTRLREELEAEKQGRDEGWKDAQRLAGECGSTAKERDDARAEVKMLRERLEIAAMALRTATEKLNFGGSK